MNKSEIERILIGDEALRTAFEKQAANRCKCPPSQDDGVSQVKRVPTCCEPNCQPTKRKGSPTFSVATADLTDMLPAELRRKSAKELLKMATELHARRPSRNRATFLEYAINRVALPGNLGREIQSLVDKAVKVLTETPIEPLAGREQSADKVDCISTWVYKDKDFGGKQLFINDTVADGGIYKQVRASTLKSFGLNDAISSIKLICSPDEEGADVYLFQDDRYSGNFVHYSAAAGSETDVNYVGNSINDKTSSILVFRRCPNMLVPIMFGDSFSRSDIADYVRNQPHVASVRGLPIFTWDMWPDGTGGHPLAPEKTYIYIRIPIVVDVPHWFDYNAEIRFWIGLSVENEQLQSSVEWYGAWVEGGIKTDDVLNGLMNGLAPTLDYVNGLIVTGLAVANNFKPFSSFYLLPGRNGDQGNTNDDVTIVLVQYVPQGDYDDGGWVT